MKEMTKVTIAFDIKGHGNKPLPAWLSACEIAYDFALMWK